MSDIAGLRERVGCYCMSMVLEGSNGFFGASIGGGAWVGNALVTHEIRNVMYYLHKLA